MTELTVRLASWFFESCVESDFQICKKDKKIKVKFTDKKGKCFAISSFQLHLWSPLLLSVPPTALSDWLRVTHDSLSERQPRDLLLLQQAYLVSQLDQ